MELIRRCSIQTQSCRPYDLEEAHENPEQTRRAGPTFVIDLSIFAPAIRLVGISGSHPCTGCQLIGLLAGKRVGAITYSLVHHKAVGLVAYVLGSLLGLPLLALTGVLLFGHSSLDRVLGLQLLEVSSERKPAVESVGQRA
jgi:hypothetical protein